MNFVDTAITLLHESGRPMAAQELCDLALDRGLLDKPGANPLRSMKTRLTVELKKGKKSRVLRDGDEAWTLGKGVALPEGAPAPDKTKAAPKKAAAKSKATAKAPAKAKPAAKAKAPAKAKPAAKAKVKAKAAPKTAKAKTAAKTKPAAKPTASAAKTAKPKAAAKPAAKAAAKEKATKEAKPAKAKAEAKPAAKASAKNAKPATKPADAAEATAPAKKTRRSRKSSASKRNSEASVAPEVEEEIVVVEPPVKLTEEEEALVALYGSSEGTRSAAELNEYRDELTKDEDRPMLPEIKAERRPHRGRERERDRDRTRKRRSRPDRSERSDRSDRPERSSLRRSESGRSDSSRSDSSRSSGRTRPTSSAPRDIAGAPIVLVDADATPREQLTAAAYGVLAALPAGQSMPVRQLTQALIRQGHLSGGADSLWRMVKGTLLVSEQRRSTRGLAPLVRYRGKDLFSAGATHGRSAVDLAEAALAKAAENYAAAALQEMQSRLAQLAPQMLERIAYVYLQSTGWKDISWIKRVEKSSYALAVAPGAVDQTMIAVRGGPSDIDRRGVGELRAGLYAKDLDSGLLLSPCPLSEEAETELAKEGAHVRLVCGGDFIRDLVAQEVGVSWRHQQLPKIDQRFWDALLS